MTPADMAVLMARAMPDARPWSEAEFADLAARPGTILTGDARVLVIGQVVAEEAEIFMVLTDPAHRRTGLARDALARFEQAAREAGAIRTILDVAADNDAARALYDRAGYVCIAERRAYYPRPEGDAVAAHMLEKRL
ncbi:GNAT family N-acetyltransferase [Salibaculum griseiflavum]|uniref:Ribosomal-protein-alanine acetyltransferase n=1 Tax=Salibaculum griseiflavum TaxID=1914409 RepID=A0A2V1P5B5_9RHOB|nr:GNAT family N-acetyltransferase [Salibaculum griseiflavum]PWG17645.1 ribosomal-protein-alanine acetyltransferase [Salibaculum griseiflavum]